MMQEQAEIYSVRILFRPGYGQAHDDYHATVLRGSDRAQLVFISRWLWVLRWKIRRKALDRAFRRHDKYQKKVAIAWDEWR